MKKLPIGIQTFSKIREEDFVYIDKTPLVHQMVDSAGRFFLSRPRRFGKSLLVDTFKELFEGNQALFKGLYIEDKWDWSKTYPVIKLSFGGSVVESRTDLDQLIYNLLKENQRRLNLTCDQFSLHDPAGCLAQLIQIAAELYQQKVVVLVDEYDKPILDNIDHPELAASIRDGLKNIYSVLKDQDAYIQFVFMTGVTKFSKVSLFSGMNQLKDITLDANYATVCGYTQQDLQITFPSILKVLTGLNSKTGTTVINSSVKPYITHLIFCYLFRIKKPTATTGLKPATRVFCSSCFANSATSYPILKILKSVKKCWIRLMLNTSIRLLCCFKQAI
jgi:hypothetical protein